MRAPRGLPVSRGLPVLAALLALAVAPALPPGPLAAQQEVSLDRVDALITDGRTEEARRVLERWWRDGGRTGASRVEEQRSLWLRALLTPDPERASLDYQRLVVEYPGGPFSDEALLRLAQAAHARGDLPGAAERFRAILRDYPDSPASLEARGWIDRYGEAAATVAALDGPGTPAARNERPPPARAPSPDRDRTLPRTPAVEERPSSRPVAPAVEDRPEAREETPSARLLPSVEDGNFGAQAGAFATPRRARDLAGRLRGEGYDARVVVVPADRLLRVRVGRLASRADAAELVRRLAEDGFDARVVDDVRRESEADG